MTQGEFTGLGQKAMDIAAAEISELNQIESDLDAGRDMEALAGMRNFFHRQFKPKPVDREKYASNRDREKARA